MNKIQVRKTIYWLSRQASLLLHQANSSIFILSYHSISNDGWRFSIPLEDFTQQVKHLSKTYMSVTLRDVENHIFGKKQITHPSFVITFDDGYRDILSTLSICSKFNIRPCVFVLANPKKADRNIISTDKPFLSIQEMKTLIKQGWTIGCHSATHADLSILSPNALKHEISGAKKILENSLGVPVTYFSYPKSEDGPHIAKAVQQARYHLACTVGDEDISTRTNPYLVPRIGVDGSHDFNEFQSLYLPTTKFIRGLLRRTPWGATA